MMLRNMQYKSRAIWVGILIIAAYSMLTYTITEHIMLGVITDIVSGLAVIGTAVLMYPVFNVTGNQHLNFIYLGSKVLEGILVLIGGISILFPTLVRFRTILYDDIFIYFFIIGALFFYILLYRIRVIPTFISIWGICSTVILIVMAIIKLTGINTTIIDIFILPVILNEIFLAVWLMVKGFNKSRK
ncbi:DUF4386 domain-containing protein [Vallitalea pronyensis]|uniref:DUF4386 domain-containing protein n=1 Tax=Vallitalea pronyensis TaxID=1348613 RepID=A0A8J8MI49_9FIRM|nr:DUF4386 domain-containing protein [Vallitalea pronyensis]QUI22070.1 DUF4386 domain-containing protein [Vallitalea pronyensis]